MVPLTIKAGTIFCVNYPLLSDMKLLFCVDIVVPRFGPYKLRRFALPGGLDSLLSHNRTDERERRQQKNE